MAKKEVKPKDDAKSELLAAAKEFFERAEAYESDQRTDELEDIKFVGLLEQWPDELRKIRENSPEGARPCLTVDKVNQYKNQIVNNIRMNTPAVKVRPVDDKADIEVAEVYNGVIRHIESYSHADDAYDWASEGAVDSGLGYFRVVTEYDGDSFNQEICIKLISNRFSVYRDYNSVLLDGSDMMQCIVTELVPIEQFKREYPDAEVANWSDSTGDDERWRTEHEVRVAEYFYIDYEKDELVLLEDGDTVYLSKMDPAIHIESTTAKKTRRDTKRRVVRWAKVTGADVLEQGVFAGEYIPIIPVFGIVTVVDGKLHWRGIVRGAKDPQRMYNYNRSTIAESLNLTVKAPYIGAVGQFDTAGDKWEDANVVNHAYLEYDPVTTGDILVPPPQRQGFAGVPAGLMADIQTSEHDIQAGLGMYQASIGQDSNAKSGKALNAQRAQGDLATFHFTDNLAKSVRHLGRILVNIIPEYYDAKKVVRIIGEDGTQDFARINTEMQVPYQEIKSQNGVEKIYNLNIGKYDVVATAGPSFSTKRQEGAEFLTTIAQSSPDLMPIMGDLLFKSLDMPYAEEMAERMKKMLPPPLQEQPEGANPEVEAVKQQATEIIGQLEQQLEAAKQAMAEAEQEAQELVRKADNAESRTGIDSRKLELEEKKLEIETFKAETERINLQKEGMEAIVNSPEFPNMLAQNAEMMLMMQNMMQFMSESTQQLVVNQQVASEAIINQLSRPKAVIRDESGKVVGVS